MLHTTDIYMKKGAAYTNSWIFTVPRKSDLGRIFWRLLIFFVSSYLTSQLMLYKNEKPESSLKKMGRENVVPWNSVFLTPLLLCNHPIKLFQFLYIQVISLTNIEMRKVGAGSQCSGSFRHWIAIQQYAQFWIYCQRFHCSYRINLYVFHKPEVLSITGGRTVGGIFCGQ